MQRRSGIIQPVAQTPKISDLAGAPLAQVRLGVGASARLRQVLRRDSVGQSLVAVPLLDQYNAVLAMLALPPVPGLAAAGASGSPRSIAS